MIIFLLKRAITETYKLKVKYKSPQMCKLVTSMRTLGFPGGSDDKESACNAGDLGSIPGLKGYPGRGHGNPLQYSCLENPTNRGAWQAVVHGVTKSRT